MRRSNTPTRGYFISTRPASFPFSCSFFRISIKMQSMEIALGRRVDYPLFRPRMHSMEVKMMPLRWNIFLSFGRVLVGEWTVGSFWSGFYGYHGLRKWRWTTSGARRSQIYAQLLLLSFEPAPLSIILFPLLHISVPSSGCCVSCTRNPGGEDSRISQFVIVIAYIVLFRRWCFRIFSWFGIHC